MHSICLFVFPLKWRERVHYSDAFNYPGVRYSGVSLYIANRFLRQSKEGKGYHQMQITVSKEDVHGSGIPWLRLTFVAITISMTLAWHAWHHKAKKEQFNLDLRRQTIFGAICKESVAMVCCRLFWGKKNHSPFPLMCTISRTRSICQNKCHSKMACQVQGGEEIQERWSYHFDQKKKDPNF